MHLRKAEVSNEVAKYQERVRTLEKWQRAYDAGVLLKHVRTWVGRKHEEVDFYMTQHMSGHGYCDLTLGADFLYLSLIHI